VIFSSDGRLIGSGHNSPPGDCPIAVCRKDTLPAGFRSDRTCCLHAEQRAIFDALAYHRAELPGATIYFVRLDANGEPTPAGEPYCTICSKSVLEVGMATFVLWHERGFVAYEAHEYNELSFAADPK
jgi:deoxycytidylate deaminase